MNARMRILFSLVALALLGGVGIAAAAPADTTGTAAGSQNGLSSSSGLIGPGNALYGLRIAFENLDESFTFNNNERLEKQVSHAEQRLAELKDEIAQNNSENADIALDEYRNKLNQTEDFLGPMGNDTGNMPEFNETGLAHAQEMLMKHQQVLEDLLQSHPNNTGLSHAYNNSVQLQEKFTMKMEVRERERQHSDNSTFTEPGFTGTITPPEEGNQTFRIPNHDMGQDGNRTAPMGWNQTEDRFRSADNSTQKMPPGMNQTMGRDNKDKNEQNTNQSAHGQNPPDQQQGAGGQGSSQNQNNNGNSGGNQNNNPNSNANTANSQNVNTNQNGNSGNAGNPAGSGNGQSTSGNRGGTGGAASNGNQQFRGR